MGWETLKYNKQEINKAGDVLISDVSSKEEKENAIKILDNWRACHSYPMHVFQMRLSNVSKQPDKNSLTAQRLKRVPSILFKLRRRYDGREPSMKLFQMQDIGGCRAILSNVALAKNIYNNSYLKGDLKHELVNKKDYITYPKSDGYRSLHLIYAYKSDKGKQEFNGLLIEIQIRSKLQHLWATAVETVGFMTRQSIKCSEGDKNWSDFFRLVSSAFAKLEGCPIVPGTPNDERELYLKIKEKAEELHIINLLKGWTSAIKFIDQQKPKLKSKEYFYLLELDIVGEKIMVSSYTEKEKERAIEDYSRAEKKYQGQKEYDVVLVGADTTYNLKKAYPNYFIDTREFLIHLNKIIGKH